MISSLGTNEKVFTKPKHFTFDADYFLKLLKSSTEVCKQVRTTYINEFILIQYSDQSFTLIVNCCDRAFLNIYFQAQSSRLKTSNSDDSS